MKTIAVILFFLVAITFCQQNTPTGANGTKSMADIVFIVDEGTMYTQKIQSWLPSSITNMEQAFLSSLPSNTRQTNNRYSLVLYGGLNSPTGRIVSIAGKEFNPVGAFLNGIRQQLTGGAGTGKNDGYSAMNLALGMPFRSNATTIFILVSTRSRDIINQTLTRNVMLNKLRQQNVLLNVVVNITFVISGLPSPVQSPVQPPLQQYPGQVNSQILPGYTRAMGILFNDQIRDTYYINENSNNPMGYSMNGHIDAELSYFTTADDYVFFAEELVRDACTQSQLHPSSQQQQPQPQPQQLRLVSGAFDIKYIIEGTVINFWNQLFSMILDLEVVISTQGLQTAVPLPQPLPPRPPTPPTSPIVGGCPPQSGIFRTRLYYVLPQMESQQQASLDCQQQGGSLSNVTEDNSAFLASLATNYTINQSVSFSDQAVWINSWDGDDYNGTPIVFFRSTVYAPPNINELHYGLCELPTVPSQCTNIGVSG